MQTGQSKTGVTINNVELSKHNMNGQLAQDQPSLPANIVSFAASGLDKPSLHIVEGL